MPSREGAATPDPGCEDHIRRDERRSGVLVILPEHKKMNNRPPWGAAPTAEPGRGMKGEKYERKD